MPKKTYFEVNEEDLKNENVITTVKFTHGRSDQVNSEKTKWQMYRRRRKNTNKLIDDRIITGEVETMKYIGKNFNCNIQTTDETCDYYIGMLDKLTGKLRVLPTELFHLHPALQGAEVLKESSTANSYREKNDELTKEFGSGKMQRLVNKRLKNQLDSDMLSSATQTATAATPIVKDEEVVNPTTTVASAVPPHNIDATTPEDVYKVDNIINPEILSGLDEMSEGMFNGVKEEMEAMERENMYANFVLKKIPTLAERQEVRRSQCQRLVYIDCLMKVYQMKYQQLRLKDPLPEEWNILVKKHILSVFFQDTVDLGRKRRTFPSAKKDLMLSHILVLCLTLNDFHLDLDHLLVDLKSLSKKRLTTHCQILGCQVKAAKVTEDGRATTTHSATLTIPLEFPENKKFKGKKLG